MVNINQHLGFQTPSKCYLHWKAAVHSSPGHRNGTAAAMFCSTASLLSLRLAAKRWWKWSPAPCAPWDARVGPISVAKNPEFGRNSSACHHVKGPRMALATDWNSSSDSRQTVPTWQTHLWHSLTKCGNIHLQTSWQVQLSQCPADEFASCRLRLQNSASCENCLKHWPRNPRTAGTVQTPTLQCRCTGTGAQQLSDCFQPFTARISELTQTEKYRTPGLNMSKWYDARKMMMQETSCRVLEGPYIPIGYPH